MNKEYHFDSKIQRKLASGVFSHKNIISLWIELLNFIQRSHYYPQSDSGVGKLLIKKFNKMNRAFIALPDKIISVNFPFSISTSDGVIKFRTLHCDNITNEVISKISWLLNEKNILEHDKQLVDFLDDMIQEDESFIDETWLLLKDLLVVDHGYLRYDHDPSPERVSKPEDPNPHSHPLHHIDIFFDKNSSFKLGLDNKIDITSFIDLLDLKTNCHFLTRK